MKSNLIKVWIGVISTLTLWVASLIIGYVVSKYAIAGFIGAYIQPVFCVRVFCFIVLSAITFKSASLIFPAIYMREVLKYDTENNKGQL